MAVPVTKSKLPKLLVVKGTAMDGPWLQLLPGLILILHTGRRRAVSVMYKTLHNSRMENQAIKIPRLSRGRSLSSLLFHMFNEMALQIANGNDGITETRVGVAEHRMALSASLEQAETSIVKATKPSAHDIMRKVYSLRRGAPNITTIVQEIGSVYDHTTTDLPSHPKSCSQFLQFKTLYFLGIE